MNLTLHQLSKYGPRFVTMWSIISIAISFSFRGSEFGISIAISIPLMYFFGVGWMKILPLFTLAIFQMNGSKHGIFYSYSLKAAYIFFGIGFLLSFLMFSYTGLLGLMNKSDEAEVLYLIQATLAFPIFAIRQWSSVDAKFNKTYRNIVNGDG